MASGQRPVILVSACLLGIECNHRGAANRSAAVEALSRSARLIPVCPEVAGGLATPRSPAELQTDGRVQSVDGSDVTDLFGRGAAQAVEVARAVGATRAVLKARSPSCGTDGVYDGTFTRTLRAGQGLTAAALVAAGVEVMSEEDVACSLVEQQEDAGPQRGRG